MLGLIVAICRKCLFPSLIENTASELHWELQNPYRNAAQFETACFNWFCRLDQGDFHVDYRLHEGRAQTFKETELVALLEEHPTHMQSRLASALKITCQTLSNQLHSFRKTAKQETLDLCDLKQRDIKHRLSACEKQLQYQKREMFPSLHCYRWWKCKSLQQSKAANLCRLLDHAFKSSARFNIPPEKALLCV